MGIVYGAVVVGCFLFWLSTSYDSERRTGTGRLDDDAPHGGRSHGVMLGLAILAAIVTAIAVWPWLFILSQP